MNRQVSRRFLMRALVCGGAASLAGVSGLWRSTSAAVQGPVESHSRSMPQSARWFEGRRILRHQVEGDRF